MPKIVKKLTETEGRCELKLEGCQARQKTGTLLHLMLAGKGYVNACQNCLDAKLNAGDWQITDNPKA